MDKLPLSGLRFRIAAALAVVLILFIVLTEVSISKLTRRYMTQRAEITAAQVEGGAGTTTAVIEQDLQRLRRPVLFYLITGAVTALLLASFAVNRLVVRPLHRLSEALEKVAEGRLDTTVPIEDSLEIAEIGRSFNRMTAKLKAQKAELESRLARIEQGARELEAAQDRLIRSAKLASVGTLAAGVAHEIGNPLAGLLGLTENLEAGVDKSEEAKFLALMKSEILRIDRIIRVLLSYARAPQSETDAPLRADFSEVLDTVRSLLTAQSIFDRIEWILPDKPIAANLAVSPDDLTQMLLNLSLNAAHAMQGEGRINVDLKQLSRWRKTPDAPLVAAVEIHMTDTGPGIPRDQASRIFDPFYTTGTTGESTGLGLSVCQNLCERAGGDLRLDAAYTEGARFVITLPCAV